MSRTFSVLQNHHQNVHNLYQKNLFVSSTVSLIHYFINLMVAVKRLAQYHMFPMTCHVKPGSPCQPHLQAKPSNTTGHLWYARPRCMCIHVYYPSVKCYFSNIVVRLQTKYVKKPCQIKFYYSLSTTKKVNIILFRPIQKLKSCMQPIL